MERSISKHPGKKQLRQTAIEIALAHNLDPAYFLAQIGSESSWNPYAVSKVVKIKHGRRVKVPCAYGVSQFTWETGNKYGLKKLSDFFNPIKSMKAQARMMKSLLAITKGNHNEAHSLYNSGRRKAYLNPRFAKGETYTYVRNINARARIERTRIAEAL